MKITLELDLDQELDIRAGRRTAVWLMGLLPADEARLAMQQWAAWREAEEAAGQPAAPTVNVVQEQPVEPPVTIIEPAPELVQEPPSARQQPAAQPAATYNQFTYDGKTYSTRKTGPSAAFKAACADILMATDSAELAVLETKLRGLKGIFLEIGREDFAQQTEEALGKRKAELSAAAPPRPPEPQEVQEQIEPQEVQEQVEPQAASAPEPSPPAAQPGAVIIEWKGHKGTTTAAVTVCLRMIDKCTTIEQLDAMTDQADQLADQLDDLGQLKPAQQIRDALTRKIDQLSAPEQQERAGPPTPRAASKELTASAANGADGDGAMKELRELMQRVQRETGIRGARELLQEHGVKELQDLDPAQFESLRAAAEAKLAGSA